MKVSSAERAQIRLKSWLNGNRSNRGSPMLDPGWVVWQGSVNCLTKLRIILLNGLLVELNILQINCISTVESSKDGNSFSLPLEGAINAPGIPFLKQ